MIKTILHIGPGKTGSSTIQTSLLLNQLELEKDGVHFLDQPERTLLAAVYDDPELIRIGMDGFEKLKRPHDDLQSIATNIRKKLVQRRCDTLIVSSEYMAPLAKVEIQRLKEVISDIGKDIRIVYYARHPLERLASLVQHYVRIGELKSSKPNAHLYGSFRDDLAPWIEVFGRKSVIVRPFDPSQWPDGNLAKDFLDSNSLRSRLSKEMRGQERANEGLSEIVVIIADALNEKFPSGHPNRAPAGYLSWLEGDKFKLPESVVNELWPRAQQDLKYLEKNFNIVLPNAPKEKFLSDARTVDLRSAAPSIASTLNSLSNLLEESDARSGEAVRILEVRVAELEAEATQLRHELSDANARKSRLAARIDWLDYWLHDAISRTPLLSRPVRSRFRAAAQRRRRSDY